MQIDNLLSRTIIYIVMHQAVCTQSLDPCDIHIDIHRHIKLLSVPYDNLFTFVIVLLFIIKFLLLLLN